MVSLPTKPDAPNQRCGILIRFERSSELKVVDLPEQQASVWNVSKICNLAIEGTIIESKTRGNSLRFPGPDYEAVERVMDQFNNGSRDCPCEPSCLEERFPATVSSVTWPSKKYMVSMKILYFLVRQEVDDEHQTVL